VVASVTRQSCLKIIINLRRYFKERRDFKERINTSINLRRGEILKRK
jgi:hypothetical protein